MCFSMSKQFIIGASSRNGGAAYAHDGYIFYITYVKNIVLIETELQLVCINKGA